MDDQDTPGHSGRPGGAGAPAAPWWRSLAVVAPAVALVVGLLIGALVVSAGDAERASAPAPTVTVTDTAAVPPGDTSVLIPQECLAAAETVAEATDVLQEGVGAVRDLRRDVLVDLLDRLEDLESQARGEAATCSEVEVASAPESSE